MLAHYTTCPYHNAVCFQDMDGSSKDHRKLKININNIKTNDYPGNILSYYHFNVCVRKSVHHPDAEILCMFLTMEHPPLESLAMLLQSYWLGLAPLMKAFIAANMNAHFLPL